MTEHELMDAIHLALGSRSDVRLWRNNVGARKVEDRFMRFGLPGSADLLGLLKGGRLLAVEVKRPGEKLSKKQEAFGYMVESFGGLFIVAYSVEGAVAAVEAALREAAPR